MYVRETIVFFGYSAQECYLFSSDTGCVPPFQGIHSYFKRADIVVIPKNAETTACLEHYKIYRLNTCALYQSTGLPVFWQGLSAGVPHILDDDADSFPCLRNRFCDSRNFFPANIRLSLPEFS